MNSIYCDIDDPNFTWLLTGEQRVIAQIRKGRWDNLFVGDSICVNRGLNGTQVDFEITALVVSASFDELYRLCGEKLLPSRPAHAWDHYCKYFSKEDESCYGVIGIEITRKSFD